jgi:hypothetical protein
VNVEFDGWCKQHRVRGGLRCHEPEVLEYGIPRANRVAEGQVEARVPDGVAPQPTIGTREPAVQRVGEDMRRVIGIGESVETIERTRRPAELDVHAAPVA